MTMLRSLPEKVNPAHTALLIVDVQRDFCAPDGAFSVLGRDLNRVQRILPRLKLLVEAARRSQVRVVFLRYVQSELTESDVHLEQRARGRADLRYCQEGTPGAEFYYVLPEAGDAVVNKHRYSGFINTDLGIILRSRGIRTIVMTGVATNGCVEATARDGFMHDFYVVFVDDCSATYSEEMHQATLANVRDAYGVVVVAEELTGIWNGGDAAAEANKTTASASRAGES
jgi:ureidoacrylate peracid hydrolase